MTTRGFTGVRCIHCGEADALGVRLDDVHTLVCRECSEEVTVDDLMTAIGKIQRLVKWLDTAPPVGD